MASARTRGLVVSALLLASAPASAQVTLPNGLVVPRDSANGEVQLYSLFSMRGEPIDWIADARSTPDVFSPLCDFTATFVLKQSGSSLGVGWYNVLLGATSAPTEIHQIVPPGSPVGTVITGANIREDARYLGGLIGFALIRSPPHYTEARWNTVCSAGACAGSPGPWILSVSYASRLVENAWYVAFEDGDTTSSSWNNDGDYNDYVFFFTGISCAGAGEACDVEGELGVCRSGLTECTTGGALECRRVEIPSAERCDGADNDCDGAIDDGDDLCGESRVCVAGVCVERCFEGGCPDGQTCSAAGVCLEVACESVTCREGERCVGGACGDACAGVVCPGALLCRVGRCVDPCTGVSCDAGRACEGGVCIESCGCRGCADGRECAASGACVPAGCAAIACGTGEVCRAGACVDACVGAICPRRQVCVEGTCVDDVTPGGDGGVRDAAVERDAGGRMDGSADGLDAAARDAGRGVALGAGCACRATHQRAPAGGMWLALAWALAWLRRP